MIIIKNIIKYGIRIFIILQRFISNYKSFKIYFIFCILLAFPIRPAYSQVYRISYGTDIPLAITGLTFLAGAYYADSKLTPLDQNEIDSADKNEINKFDRTATDNWSKKSDRISDYTDYLLIASPALLTAFSEIRNDLLIIAVMYAETLAIENGLTGIVKAAVKRKRPYVYNEDVPAHEKLNTYSKRSFYSGHTCSAFSSAVFLSTVYSEYFPHSKSRWFVWTISLSIASYTGWLRYDSGMHYPTDIIAGAVTGSLIGWLIPALHKDNFFSIIPQFSMNYKALTFQFKI